VRPGGKKKEIGKIHPGGAQQRSPEGGGNWKSLRQGGGGKICQEKMAAGRNMGVGGICSMPDIFQVFNARLEKRAQEGGSEGGGEQIPKRKKK